MSSQESGQLRKSFVSRLPVKITVWYAAFGLLWIIFSDRIADVLFRRDPDLLLQVSSAKGILFVAITSLLLFVLLRRHVAVVDAKEQKLRQSEERYRLVVEHAPDAIAIHDGVQFTYANTEAVKLFGADSLESIIGHNVLDFVPEDSRASVTERIRQNIVHNLPAQLREQRYLRLDGGIIEVEVAAVPFLFDGSPGALVFLRDVGPRKAAERKLRESETKYRLLADNAHDLISVFNAELHLTYVSPSVRRLLGFSVEEALSRSIDVSLTPESAARVRQDLHRINESGPIDRNFLHTTELEMYCKDGSTVWVESMTRGLFDTVGQFRGYISVSRDISERRKAEQELLLSRQFNLLILEAIPDPVFVKDSSHRFVLVNDALCAMLGLPANAIIGKCDADLVPREEAAVFVERDNIVLETGQADLFEECLTDAQGRVRTLVTRKGLFIDPRGNRFIVGVIRDISDDKVKELQLRDSLLEKEVLLKEVHHRVKNNLQIISSLLFLQKDAIADPHIQDIFEESRNRIASMALIHEELYRSGDLARVDLKEYLERLAPKVVQSLRGYKSIGFSLHLAQCRVSVDKAIPFGLIVNELLTNAVKHGLAGRDAGNIRVNMAFEDAMIQAVVEDDGSGLPEGFHPDAVKTLGMQLVVQLTRQLRGSLTFGSSPQGSFFRLSFPADDKAG
ncbi:PAS domain S-box protein [Desulfovibrio sp. TomC]|uniref:PAS domain S-box protein n=1 Tax=Desulfovibrio sp. TomC TaxID=1562888 RepID=UPI00064CE2C0|nr:PAS domain S-box protein [Desulfovibrio sp. TomC]